MKDSRFIELVNLYIDRQISPEEAAELEQEIQSSPRRRQVYNQYCRMHRATSLVYESFRNHATATTPAAGSAQATIERIERRQRSRRNRWTYYAGGLAAAACLTFVLARVALPSKPAADSPQVASAAAEQAITKVVPTSTPAVEPARPTFVALHNQLGDEHYAALLAALRLEQQRALTLTASRAPEAASLPASLFDDEVFDQRQVLPADARRLLRERQRLNEQNAEFTAFKFQR